MSGRRFTRPLAVMFGLIIVFEASLPVSAMSGPAAAPKPIPFTPVPVPDPEGGAGQLAAPGQLLVAPPVEAGTVIARDRYSQVLANGDGSQTATHALRPLHWRDAAGSWRAFANELAPAGAEDADAGFSHVNADSGIRVAFGAPAAVERGGPLLRFRAGGVGLSMALAGAGATDSLVEGATVTYPAVLPGVDARFTVDNERLKEELIVADAASAASLATLSYALRMEGASAKLNADGSVTFSDRDGVARISMPRPVMFDAADAPALSSAIEVALLPGAGNQLSLSLTPDPAWLADPARVYPVTIDPTFGQLEIEGEDAATDNVTINQAQPTTNYAGAPTLSVGKNGSGQRQDVLLRFPSLDGLPHDTTIVDATLQLDTISGSDGLPIDVRNLAAGFTAGSVTWNSAPAADATVWASANTDVGGETQWDVSDLVRQWVRGQTEHHGFRLISTGANGALTSFDSSYASCSGCQPQLEMTYVPATRYGLNRLWEYTSSEHGGGTSSAVNIVTGNLALTHAGGSIDTRGFSVGLTHTYNSADPFGLADYPGAAVYGEGWQFAHNLRLFELDGGNAVVLKDGSGDESRVFVRDADANGDRSYIAPLHYDLTLVKDISSPATDRVYRLTADAGGLVSYFRANGRLTRQEDRSGNFLTFAYDGSQRMTKITDVAGRQTVLAYGAGGGRLSQITDMAGRLSTYAYDASGNLTSITHADGTADEVTTTFAYDDANQLLSVTNPRGHTSLVRYAALNRWESGSVEDWAPESGNTVISHSTAQAHGGSGSLRAQLSAIPASGRAVVEKNMNADPRALSATSAELMAWIYLPAGSGALEAGFNLEYADHEARSGPWSALSAGGWNGLRLPGAQVEAGGQLREVEIRMRPPAGQPDFTGTVYIDDVALRGTVASQTDAKPTPNTIVSYAYDAEARSSQVRRPNTAGALQSTTYAYDRLGMVTSVTDPVGNVSEFAHDEFLRLREITTPGGTTSTALDYYPNSNQVQTVTGEMGEVSRRGADLANGDTRYTIDPLNEARRDSGTVSYDATTMLRDAAGRVETVANARFAAGTDLEDEPLPASQTWSFARAYEFEWLTGGLLDYVDDPRNNRTDLGWDTDTGYLLTVSLPPGAGEGTSRRVTTYTRNADGSVASATDAKGQLTTFEYDDLGRLTQTNFGVVSGVPAFSVTRTIDDNGNLTAMSDQAGSSTFTYDQNNRLTAESRTQNGTTKSVAYAYHANGTTATTTTFAGQTVSYAYDNALRLTSQTDPNDAGRSIAYGYDGRNRRSSITYGSGLKQLLTYDAVGRVASVRLQKPDGTNLQSMTYGYGFNGSTRTSAYEFGNVVSVSELGSPAPVTTYTYDDLGRLETASRTNVDPYSHAYTYDAVDNRLTRTVSGVTTTAAYDAANQLTSFGTTAYSYDRNGNLTGYSGGNTLTYNSANQYVGGTVGGTAQTFSYDGFGRRVSRAPSGNRVDAWYDQSGLTLETGAVPGTYLRDPSGVLLSAFTSADLRNYGRDRLGSVTALVDGEHNVDNLYRYDPWGNRTTNSGTAINPFKFTGHYHSTGSGLFDFGARTYDPGTARFTQADPYPANLLGPSRYAYAGCNPTNRVDPTGLDHTSLDPYLEACLIGTFIGGLTGIVEGAIVGGATAFFLGGPPGAAAGALVGAAVGGLAGIPVGCIGGILNYEFSLL